MPPKGKTNNPNGRPKGVKNKITQDTKEWVKEILEKLRPQLENDLRELDAVERWRIVEKLLPYVLPKQQAISADVSMDSNFSFEKLLMQTGVIDDEEEENETPRTPRK